MKRTNSWNSSTYSMMMIFWMLTSRCFWFISMGYNVIIPSRSFLLVDTQRVYRIKSKWWSNWKKIKIICNPIHNIITWSSFNAHIYIYNVRWYVMTYTLVISKSYPDSYVTGPVVSNHGNLQNTLLLALCYRALRGLPWCAAWGEGV